MTIDDKLISLVIKLNRLTSQGKVTWHVEDPPSSILQGADDHIPLFFVTTYKSQKFALYQNTYQSLDRFAFKLFFRGKEIILAILDNKGRVLWEKQSTNPALVDLFETVRRKVSNIDNVIDALLSDDDEVLTSSHP